MHRRDDSLIRRPSLIALAVLALAPATLAAQVELRVVEATSNLPIAYPLVRILDADQVEVGSRAGDAAGVVELDDLPTAGTLVIEAIGFQTYRLPVPDSGSVRVEMETIPVELEGLDVTVEGRGRSEFSARRATGNGLFLDPADVQLKVEYHVTDAFRDLPGVRRSIGRSPAGLPALISSLGSGCFAVRLDNLPLDLSTASGSIWREWPLNMVTTENVMAIEVYRYFGEVPPELRHQATVGDAICGLIIIWTTVAW